MGRWPELQKFLDQKNASQRCRTGLNRGISLAGFLMVATTLRTLASPFILVSDIAEIATRQIQRKAEMRRSGSHYFVCTKCETAMF
jgi:hypothetical protein